MILALSALFVAAAPPRWVQGAGGGAGPAVPAVAQNAALALLVATGAGQDGRVVYVLCSTAPGPAAVGAMLGSAAPLAAALHAGWQYVVLAAAAAALLLLRRGVVVTLLGVGVAVGVAAGAAVATLAGATP